MMLETSFLYKVIFSIIKICYKLQNYCSKVFWFLFIKPALFIAALHCPDREDIQADNSEEHQSTFLIIDTLIWSHKAIWSYLQWAFKVNGYISGVKHKYNLFEHLLTWNMNIPILGFQADKTTYSIELLYKKTERGRSCDFTWLTTHNICGEFKIISKGLNDKGEEFFMKAAWLTGEDRGKLFEVHKCFPYKGNISSGHYDKL
ncbi:MAG: hypothetical protein VX341_13770 [Bdellovibrionota bacterium]|nr:hypothetical protein [Bdellovibrionota bacterium]